MRTRVILGFAGLDEDDAQYLKSAGKLLGVFKVEARIQPWQAMLCDVLVARVDAEAGRAAMAQARERSLPVLALVGEQPADAQDEGAAAGSQALLSRAPMHRYLAALRAVIDRVDGAGKRGAAAPANAQPQPLPEIGLCQLAVDPSLRGRDLFAVSHGRRLHLCPGQGKVHAASHSDLLTARSYLPSPGWRFAPLRRSTQSGCSIAVSLDGFMLQGAMAARQVLPPYPDTPCYLVDWPDLGSATQVPAAIDVAAVLIRGRIRPSRLAQVTHQAQDVVNACLWALRAADLLRHDDEAALPPAAGQPELAARSFTGVMARIARRFGVSRRY